LLRRSPQRRAAAMFFREPLFTTGSDISFLDAKAIKP
jgi:hypothetical protein